MSTHLPTQKFQSHFIATLLRELFKTVKSQTTDFVLPTLQNRLRGLLSEELRPVLPETQSLVPPPEGLDLHAWIGDPFPDEPQDWSSSSEDNDEDEQELQRIIQHGTSALQSKHRFDPYYIQDVASGMNKRGDDLDSIPIVALTIDESVSLDVGSPLNGTPTTTTPTFLTRKTTPKKYTLNKDVELPPGVTLQQVQESSPLKKGEKGKGVVVRDLEALALQSVDWSRGEGEYVVVGEGGPGEKKTTKKKKKRRRVRGI
jgi:AP-3 complex subunit delta-1